MARRAGRLWARRWVRGSLEVGSSDRPRPRLGLPSKTVRAPGQLAAIRLPQPFWYNPLMLPKTALTTDGPDWERLKQFLRGKDSFCLTSHVFPEGDAIGSELALARALRKLGKKTRIVNAHPIPEQCRFLDTDGEVEVYQPAHDRVFRKADIILVLDVGVYSRLGEVGNIVKARPCPVVCIDHHATNERIGDLNILDLEASAVAEMMHPLIVGLGVELDESMAVPLFVGIATDTGWFHFMNTSARAMRVASELVAAGADPPRLYAALYETRRPERMKLLGEALCTLETDCGGRLAWFSVTREMFERSRAVDEDLEGFVDELKSIKGTEVVVLFREMADGSSKANLRSKSSANVARVAVEFGGGGHHHSAAINGPGPLAEFRERVLVRLREELLRDS